ncbi:hypothetical protein, partial [Ralstonia pseudosolanacearum]|uniref:hypothetical protein n=1 Tax=Ralstonia pseudosolanacearum TaxID=1310165 RepID=UPI003C7EAE41
TTSYKLLEIHFLNIFEQTTDHINIERPSCCRTLIIRASLAGNAVQLKQNRPLRRRSERPVSWLLTRFALPRAGQVTLN